MPFPGAAARRPGGAFDAGGGGDGVFSGYVLRDLRRMIGAMLPRYERLLDVEERAALAAFGELPLRAQQLYARLLGRKWPRWVQLEGLGAKYRELGEEGAGAAVQELLACPKSVDLTLATQACCCAEELPEDAAAAEGGGCAGPPADFEPRPSKFARPWLLDTALETPASLLAKRLDLGQAKAAVEGGSFGALLLDALPKAQLRQMAGALDAAKKRRGSKASGSVSALCSEARRQRTFPASTDRAAGTMEARLVAQALASGRWVCVAPTAGRSALTALTELFHLESCGAPDSAYVLFSTSWPGYSLEAAAAAKPLFEDRASLDEFLAARRLVLEAELGRQVDAESIAGDAALAESQLQRCLATPPRSPFEEEKLHSPFRRRFTASWCWAEALHHAVSRAPAAGDDEVRAAKIRRLRLLMGSRLCSARRGRWYNELAKEVARSEGALAALALCAEGLAEGEPPPVPTTVEIDLCSEPASPAADEPAALPQLPTDARWELAQRAHALARRVRPARGCAWRGALRATPAARALAEGGDDGGRWLPALVERLRAEEAAAVGPVRCICASSLGMPTEAAPPAAAKSAAAAAGRPARGGRRWFAGADLALLSVEELAIRHYLSVDAFDCGIHCEGALLRDLFGILLFDQLFDTSVEGVFASEYQDAPMDLGTEVFYSSRRAQLERRLADIAALSPEDLAAEVLEHFAAAHGRRVRGVRWDRYKGPCGGFRCEGDEGELGRRTLWTRQGGEVEDCACTIGAAAGAVGGRALAAALRQLCLDYNAAGLPDLLVWSWGGGRGPRARFVEVKSERDTLSRRQRVWLSIFRGAGAEAEVCHIRDVDA